MGMAKTFTDQLRYAIDHCGMSRYRLAKEVGISQTRLCRFMAGEGLSVKNLDAICSFLDLELKPRRTARGRKAGRHGEHRQGAKRATGDSIRRK